MYGGRKKYRSRQMQWSLLAVSVDGLTTTPSRWWSTCCAEQREAIRKQEFGFCTCSQSIACWWTPPPWRYLLVLFTLFTNMTTSDWVALFAGSNERRHTRQLVPVLAIVGMGHFLIHLHLPNPLLHKRWVIQLHATASHSLLAICGVTLAS